SRNLGGQGTAAKTQVGTLLFHRIDWREQRIAVDEVVREVVTEEKRRCAYPGFAAIPAFHIWRRKKNLAHLPHRVLSHGRGGQIRGEQLRRLNEILHGTLDLIAHGRVGIKFPRAENLAQDWAHLKVVFADSRRDGGDDLRRRLVFREEPPEFPGEKLRTRGLLHQS